LTLLNNDYTFSLIDFGTPAHDETVRLRRDILRIPLGLEFYAKDLALEYDQYHLAGYDTNGDLVACLWSYMPARRRFLFIKNKTTKRVEKNF